MWVQQRLPFDTPEAHATILHPTGQGKVTVARKEKNWSEMYVPISELPYVVQQLAGYPDVYISQNRFNGPRKIALLAQLDALFVDLDYYHNASLVGCPPEHVLEIARMALEDERLPQPSYAVNTGRGVALVWLHSPVPRQALPRWNACQQRLWEALSHLGADQLARDAARVLRLVGTRNSKTGTFVESMTPAAEPWDFDTLADEILPLTRAELYDLRIRRAQKGAQKPLEASKTTPPQGFTQATLWEARLSDLQRLLQLRYGSMLPPGQRDAWMFVAGVAMSWLAIPVMMQRELWALAHQVAGWDDREAKSRLQAVMKRCHMAANGQTVEYNGMQVDARYRLKTQTILEWLEITPAEQLHMQTLIGEEVARERHRKAEAERKRLNGEVKVDRDTYRGQAILRREEAQIMRQQGMSYRQIAQQLGCSHSEIIRLLK